MELTFAQQSSAFLLSLLLGIAAGVLYGILRVLRVLFFRGRISVFIIDFLYMIAVSLALFCFSIAYINGAVRIYLYFGCLIGFVLYRGTLGRLISAVTLPVARYVICISRKIQVKIKFFAKKLLKNIVKILYNNNNKNSISKNKNKDKEKRELNINEKR